MTLAPGFTIVFIQSLTNQLSFVLFNKGGSLIAPDIVLSAAHCAGYSSTIEIGRFDRSKGTMLDEQVLESLLAESQDGVINLMSGDYYESIEVEYEIKHPGYDSTTVDNDFLLLKLNKVSMVPNPPLANLNTDPDTPAEKGTELLVMGWGDTDADPNVNTPSDVLLGADLNYLSNTECRAIEGEVDDEEKGTMYVSFRPMITVSSSILDHIMDMNVQLHCVTCSDIVRLAGEYDVCTRYARGSCQRR